MERIRTGHPGSGRGLSLAQAVCSGNVCGTQAWSKVEGTGRRKGLWDGHAGSFGGHFYTILLWQLKKGPGDSVTRLWSQGKSVAHAGPDPGLPSLLSTCVSLVQLEFSCPAPGQGGCLFLQPVLFHASRAGDTEAQRAVFHTFLPMGALLAHSWGPVMLCLCGVWQEPGHP